MKPKKQPFPVPTPVQFVGGRHGETLRCVLFRRHSPSTTIAGPDPDFSVSGLIILVIDGGDKGQPIGILGPGEVGVPAPGFLMKRPDRGLFRSAVVDNDAVALALRRRGGNREHRCAFGKGEGRHPVDGALVAVGEPAQYEFGSQLFVFALRLFIGRIRFLFGDFFDGLVPAFFIRLVCLLVSFVGQPETVAGERNTLDLVDPLHPAGLQIDDGQSISRSIPVVIRVFVLGLFAFFEGWRDGRDNPPSIRRDHRIDAPLDDKLRLRRG